MSRKKTTIWSNEDASFLEPAVPSQPPPSDKLRPVAEDSDNDELYEDLPGGTGREPHGAGPLSNVPDGNLSRKRKGEEGEGRDQRGKKKKKKKGREGEEEASRNKGKEEEGKKIGAGREKGREEKLKRKDAERKKLAADAQGEPQERHFHGQDMETFAGFLIEVYPSPAPFCRLKVSGARACLCVCVYVCVCVGGGECECVWERGRESGGHPCWHGYA
jgi:hypothetical protein